VTAPPTDLFLDDPWLSLVGILAITGLVYVELFLHELGHWVVARFFGHRVITVSLGQGKLLKEWRNDEHPRSIQMRLLPVGGYVLPINTTKKRTRLSSFLISAAGPLMTAVFGGAMYWLYHHFDFGSVLPHPWAIVAQQVVAISMVLAGISFAYNVFPHQFRLGTESVGSDGTAMLSAIIGPFDRRPFHERAVGFVLHPTGDLTEKAKSLVVAGAAAGDSSTELTTAAGEEYEMMFHYHLHRQDYEAAGQVIEAAIGDKSISPTESVFFDCRLSDLALDYQRSEFVDRAAEAMERVMTILPGSEIMRVRGDLLLVLQCFYDDARRSLDEILDTTKSSHVKACCLSVIAIADARQERMESARQRLQEATKMRRGCEFQTIAERVVLGNTMA